MMPWSGLLPINVEHTYELGTSELHLNQHHVGSPALTTDRSMHPGCLKNEGGGESVTIKCRRDHDRSYAAALACRKTLDRYDPVTEVLTLAK